MQTLPAIGGVDPTYWRAFALGAHTRCDLNALVSPCRHLLRWLNTRLVWGIMEQLWRLPLRSCTRYWPPAFTASICINPSRWKMSRRSSRQAAVIRF
ncbi:protein of unknown function [Paraburkholderia dioscoreae]|uniref:Uncharacterized protein n=1 Tax=Paraburkholderia dioscoreae TaxID=2604047 RepID=A0A5Q4YXF2_9BURK|nr:protein of unknown function [Paraburkholderia dioscoreae]